MLRMHGVDIDEVLSKSPARAWNVIYALLIDGMDKKERAKLDSDLFKRPPGVYRGGGDAFDASLAAGAAAYAKSLPPPPPAIDS